jgi:nucleotide-binding universal stress UspA family protein
MTADVATPNAQRAVLVCFDGSRDAADAIAVAGGLLSLRTAVVVNVWEPVALWEPYDPGAVVSGGLSRLGAKALGLDEIASDLARSTVEHGVALARDAGLDAHGRVASGKAWRAICDAADDVDAALIVLGARGLSRVRSLLLGSVSAAVLAHAGRPVLVVPGPHAAGSPGPSP